VDLEEDDLDALDAYQSIVDEVIAGRTEGHKCPSCLDDELECDFDGLRITLTCRKCGRFFEGVLG
jgi:ribosomal protein L37AE/L43A